jgi:tol-pal system protein YbgF
MTHCLRSWTALALAVAALLAPLGASASLFSDDEARLAIRDLRQRVEALRQQNDAQRQLIEQQATELKRTQEEGALARRSALELQNQIDALRTELARLRGQDEQFARELSELQRRHKDVAQGVDERLRRFEPVKVTLDGRDFMADPAEVREYEAAFAVFRKGEFPTAQTAFAEFLRRYPQSGYAHAALFWQANAQYGVRDYRGAIANFRALLARSPQDTRAPEAALAIANCQIELKETAAARKTLADLIKAYPESEAAGAARERLARLR